MANLKTIEELASKELFSNGTMGSTVDYILKNMAESPDGVVEMDILSLIADAVERDLDARGVPCYISKYHQSCKIVTANSYNGLLSIIERMYVQ